MTTSDEVLGISVPMATAIADAAAARREYLDETGGRYVHVVADGDIHTSGELAKAIACGADAVMLGTPLAEAAEALGEGWFWPAAAAHPSLPRGALLQIAVGERPPLEQVLNGPSDEPFGTLNLAGVCADRWPRPVTATSRSSRRSAWRSVANLREQTQKPPNRRVWGILCLLVRNQCPGG